MNSKGNVPSAAKPVKDLGGLMRWRKYVKYHYSQKHYVFFILALDTGVAPGKLLKLTWKQIENQTITPCASFIGKKRKRACLGY